MGSNPTLSVALKEPRESGVFSFKAVCGEGARQLLDARWDSKGGPLPSIARQGAPAQNPRHSGRGVLGNPTLSVVLRNPRFRGGFCFPRRGARHLRVSREGFEGRSVAAL